MINRTSFKFSHEFGYKEEALKNCPIERLVPEYFMEIIRNIEVGELELQQDIIIPLLTYDGFMQFRKCKVYLCPRFIPQVEFLYYLEHHSSLNESSLLMYDKETLNVMGFNSKLVEKLQLSKKKVIGHMKNTPLVHEILNVNLEDSEAYDQLSTYNGLKAKLLEKYLTGEK